MCGACVRWGVPATACERARVLDGGEVMCSSAPVQGSENQDFGFRVSGSGFRVPHSPCSSTPVGMHAQQHHTQHTHARATATAASHCVTSSPWQARSVCDTVPSHQPSCADPILLPVLYSKARHADLRLSCVSNGSHLRECQQGRGGRRCWRWLRAVQAAGCVPNLQRCRRGE